MYAEAVYLEDTCVHVIIMGNSSCGMTSSLLNRYVMHDTYKLRLGLFEAMKVMRIGVDVGVYVSASCGGILLPQISCIVFDPHITFIRRVPVLRHEKNTMFLVNLVGESRRTKLQTVCLVIPGCYICSYI